MSGRKLEEVFDITQQNQKFLLKPKQCSEIQIFKKILRRNFKTSMQWLDFLSMRNLAADKIFYNCLREYLTVEK